MSAENLTFKAVKKKGERPILQQSSYFTGLISGRKGSYLGPHFAKSPFLSYFGYTKVLIVTTL